MLRILRGFAWTTGVACVAIGVFHFLFGIASVPGEGAASATVDSRERFYNAIFVGYGLAWIWAARQRPLAVLAIRWLAGIFLLGGVGRLLSLLLRGEPHWFQLVLGLIEIALPPVYFMLSRGPDPHRVAPPPSPPATAERGQISREVRPAGSP